MLLNIEIEPTVKDLFPQLMLGCISANICVAPASDALKTHIEQICRTLASTISPDVIRCMPAIDATRNTYRQLGKDPSRYRPSAESLLRRIASGKKLYSVNNAVDVLNLASIQTGFSICGYDADTVEGTIHFRVGRSCEPYEGIGRGMLNIENLPVFSDNKGAFGTPTSDSTRTMIKDISRRMLMIFPAFSAELNLEKALDLSAHYLKQYVCAENINYGFIGETV